MRSQSFASAVRLAIDATPITDLLRDNSAVVLERIAMGGGDTRWYFCSSQADLEAMEARFSPGSVVSFYFDKRIRKELYSSDVRSNIEKILARDGEVIIGSQSGDPIRIEVEIITGPNELAEYSSTLDVTSQVFYGTFPKRENDGVQAVTVTLPDADGIVRAHPH